VTFGTVEPEPASQGRPAAGARVASPVAGLVEAVTCAEGLRVKQGEILVRLDTRLADVMVARGENAVKFGELNAARQRTMASSQATSQKALEEAEQQLAAARSELATAQAERQLLFVRAPLAGTVVRLNARSGDAVDLTTVLAEIVDPDRLVVAGGVRSAEAALLKEGQRVELADRGASSRATGQPGPLLGKLVFVGAQIDPRNDTVPVRVLLPAGSGLTPGRFLDVRIVAEERADCLVVPEESVVSDGQGGSAVATVEGDKAIVRPVKTGLREDGMVEVAGEGIKEGTPVVTEGAYGLPKETKVHLLDK